MKDGMPLKCLILSAGLGTRLRPLTDVLPKPLAPVLNVPLFDLAVRQCVAAGALDLAVNTHHLASVMAEHARSVYRDLGARSLYISEETPEILGTGGALAQIAPWWDHSPLLVYNGDILSDIPLIDLVAKHRARGPLVTMAVRKNPPRDGGRSVWVDSAGHVKAICRKDDLPSHVSKEGLQELGFACAYVAEPELQRFLPIPAKFHDVISSFQSALLAGREIFAVTYEGLWADIGTPRSLWETNLFLAGLDALKRRNLFGNSAVSPRQGHEQNASIDDLSVIANDVTIGPGAIIEKSLLLPGAVVRSGETLSHAIRGLGIDLRFD